MSEQEQEPDTENVLILPSFVKWTSSQIYDNSHSVLDYNTLDELDKAMQKAQRSLFLLTDKINEYEREEKLAKTAYERTLRRAYLESNGKTESERKARAELKCEELENEWLKNEQLKSELIRMSYTVRQELQTLQTLGNNMRQQLKTM